MKLVGADANFRAETKFTAIGEPRRGVPVNRRGIDFVQEFLSVRGVAGDDDVAMMRAVFFDVLDGFVDVVYRAGSEDEIEIFGGPVFAGGGTKGLIIESCELTEGRSASRSTYAMQTPWECLITGIRA